MNRKVSLVNSPIARMTTKRVPTLQKKVDEHYMSQEFIQWSKDVKTRAGYRCEKCGRAETRMFADHIKEIKDGGLFLDLMNGQCLCGSCHTRKTWDEKRHREERMKSITSGGSY